MAPPNLSKDDAWAYKSAASVFIEELFKIRRFTEGVRSWSRHSMFIDNRRKSK